VRTVRRGKKPVSCFWPGTPETTIVWLRSNNSDAPHASTSIARWRHVTMWLGLRFLPRTGVPCRVFRLDGVSFLRIPNQRPSIQTRGVSLPAPVYHVFYFLHHVTRYHMWRCLCERIGVRQTHRKSTCLALSAGPSKTMSVWRAIAVEIHRCRWTDDHGLARDGPKSPSTAQAKPRKLPVSLDRWLLGELQSHHHFCQGVSLDFGHGLRRPM
jgi:hypothetical protein